MGDFKLKVLPGGRQGGGMSSKYAGLGMVSKGKALTQIKPKRTFLKARATNTRLMGVVGLVMDYLSSEGKHQTLVFHLDYEEYGIDGYACFTDEAEDYIEREITRVTGGLGGSFEQLTEDQAKALIYEAYAMDPESVHVVYDLQPEFADLLSLTKLTKEEDETLMKLIGPEPISDLGLLNFALMRMIGLDEHGYRFLADVSLPGAWHQEVSSPGTLLRNVISILEAPEVEGVKELKAYRCEALIDHLDRYKLVHIQFQIAQTTRGRKIVGLMIEAVMNISAYEASFQLRKREHLAIYEVMDESFFDLFEEDHPEMMINTHGAGDLFTEFNNNNEHVEKTTYYLSGDVFANYYLTDEEQMVVCSFSLENLDEIEVALSHSYDRLLVKIGEMTADQSILYDFVNSGYGNIYAYLEDTRP